MIKLHSLMEMKQDCPPIPLYVLYAIITWSFNEQHGPGTVTFPVPKHRSTRDKHANENVSILPSRPIKKMQALRSPRLMHVFCWESWRERRNKVILGSWWLEIGPWFQKNSPEMARELSSWTTKQYLAASWEAGTLAEWVR